MFPIVCGRPEAEEDRALSAAQAAAMIGVSPQWLYRHTRTLPFTRKPVAEENRVLRGRHSALAGDASAGRVNERSR